MAAQKPVHEIRIGRIRASVWENQTEQGVRYNVTLQRLYKDESGWKSTASFGRNDLPLVSLVSSRAFCWIHENGPKPE